MNFQEASFQSSTKRKAARKPSFLWDGETLILNPADKENGEPFNAPVATKKRRRTSRTKRVGGGSFLSMFNNFIPVEDADCTSLDSCPFEQDLPLLPASELLRLVECTKMNHEVRISLHGNDDHDIAIDDEGLDEFANVQDHNIEFSFDCTSNEEYSTSVTLESNIVESEQAQHNSYEHTDESSLSNSFDGSFNSKSQSDSTYQESSHGEDLLLTSITPIILTDADVLLGRGNRSNGHAGNERFRELVEKRKPIYRKQGNSKKGKNAVSIDVMEAVHAYGGRFLEIISKPRLPLVYKVADKKKARKKCSQRLREGEHKSIQ